MSRQSDSKSNLVLRLLGGASLLAASVVSGSSLALAQTAPTPSSSTASPQTAPESATAPPPAATQLDEVVVTGIRASLRSAIDTKRNSDVIVDSIAAEDIGKFPDSNVAEALQRISGVSIDRSDGEGRFVTVRGFGPQFNEVLVNGRQLASENPGRQFSFDLLAADLISGADVYKTTDASLQEGGIGATINLKTARPLDIPGQKIIFSAKANYEDQSGQAAPDVFALYSNKFLDGRLGFLASVSYEERKATVDSDTNDGYYLTNVATLNPKLQYSFPQDYYQVADQEDRKRLGITSTLQYKPMDDLILTLDGIYNNFNVKSSASEISHFFTPTGVSNVGLDSQDTVVSFNQDSTGHTDYVRTSFNRPTELDLVGFNANWSPTNHVNVKFDSSYSRATDNDGGNDYFTVIGFNNPISFSSAGGGLPSLTAANGFTNPTVGHAHFAEYDGSNIGDTVYQQRLDGTFKTDYEHFTEVRAGVIYSDETKTNQLVATSPSVYCTYCGYSIPVPLGILQPYNPGSFLSGLGGNFPHQWLTYNPQTYFNFLNSQAAANAQDAAVIAQDAAAGLPPAPPIGTSYANLLANGGYAPKPQPSSYSVHEKVTGGYAQADFKGIIGGVPWSATLGARYVHTDLTAIGTEQPLVELNTNPADSTLYLSTLSSTQQPITEKSSYNDFLPTLNIKVKATDDMIVRFAATQTVTRPNLTDVAPQISYTQLRPANLQASSGNPELQPYKSTNFDLSYEWYYQRTGYFTVGAFYKELHDFIVNGNVTEAFTLTPTTAFPTGQANFTVNEPRNIGDADVYGLEVGFQHTFDYLPAPFDGLGFTINATFLKSDTAQNSNSTSSTLALPGLGDSQNLIAFYSKGPFDFRVAYNRRDAFLSTQSNSVGGDPIYTKTAGQVDVQGRYSITKNFSVVVEGINLNNALVQTYDGKLNQFLGVVETGPRFAAGFRAEF